MWDLFPGTGPNIGRDKESARPVGGQVHCERQHGTIQDLSKMGKLPLLYSPRDVSLG